LTTAEAAWQRAARSEDVDRVLRRVHVDDEPVLVARTAEGWPVAVGPICPHQDLPMDGGNIYFDEIDCPNHHYTYDARTGENRYPKRVFPKARADKVQPIRVFKTREEDGWVWFRSTWPAQRGELGGAILTS
jgi:nitrite reductase/ring-hydroxylating ferredoxin subunit